MSVLVAAALDQTLREPPAAVHPVVWTGRYLTGVGRVVPARPPRLAVAVGAGVWLGGAVAAVVTARAIERGIGRAPRPARAALRGLALWPLLSARMLFAEVQAVEDELQQDLSAGRVALGRIVGRDTARLSAEEVRGAALESLAENLSDSVVAPLLWYVVAGLPGAALYRYANTADACWGYRTPRWEHAGRVAARFDDALNLVPARITALLLAVPDGRLPEEAHRTASPNAGWPMAALALHLDVRLSKRDHYELNPTAAEPAPEDVSRALRVARRAALLATALAAVGERLPHRPAGGR